MRGHACVVRKLWRRDQLVGGSLSMGVMGHSGLDRPLIRLDRMRVELDWIGYDGIEVNRRVRLRNQSYS